MIVYHVWILTSPSHESQRLLLRIVFEMATLARLLPKALSTKGGEMSGENGRIHLFQSHDTLSPISICTLLSCAMPYRFCSILLRTGAIYSPDSRNRETLQRREQQIQYQA